MSIWKTRGKCYTYQFEYQKQRHSKSGFRTKAEAKRAQEKHRTEVRQGKTQTGMAFSEVANLYLDWSKRRHAKKTYEYKRGVFKAFLLFWGDNSMVALTPQILHRYLNTRPSNNNYNAHRKELCALISFSRNQLALPIVDICRQLQKMPIKRAEKEIPSQESIIKLLLASTPEEKALLLTILHTAGRIDEILRLTWEDVNFEKTWVRLWTRKKVGGNWKARFISMNHDLHGVLWTLWKKRLQEKWVFYNRKTVNRYNRRPKLMPGLCRRAGVRPFGFHALRHMVPSFLRDKHKINISLLQKLLGHETQGTTEIYLHVIDESEREMMEKLEGAWG